MAASVSGAMTVTKTVAPHLTGSVLTALMAIAPENMTFAQLLQVLDACKRVSEGSVPSNTIKTILT